MEELLPTSPETIRRAGTSASSFTLFHLFGGRVLCAESVNALMDHMMSRKLIAAGGAVNPACLADREITMNSLLA